MVLPGFSLDQPLAGRSREELADIAQVWRQAIRLWQSFTFRETYSVSGGERRVLRLIVLAMPEELIVRLLTEARPEDDREVSVVLALLHEACEQLPPMRQIR